jgi:ATP-dependent helicase HrpA
LAIYRRMWSPEYQRTPPWATVELRWPEGLPVVERRDEIAAAVRDHQVVVVAGETGSGKSTQLPKICLEAGRGEAGLIGHTQPRRIAARAVAERVAEELGSTVGGLVGYTVRFTDRVGEGTRVKVMTDGILLAELQRDRELSRYDTLIVDEAHERSLNIDFILGYLKQLLPRRPDLKVVVTSATIDTERFAAHFGGAPVIEVTGRTYPVEVRYRPFGEAPGDDRDQVSAVCDALEELAREGPGDVLVFLSGEREIRDTAEAVERLALPHTEVLPLYARLSAEEQHRVFRPHKGRRVVLATNVAETSLTVPGIRAVVDPGTARVSRYNRRTKVQRLPIEPVSRASADQRAGRCGRVGPGTCIRLYSEEDYLGRPEYTEPEVLRTNLASVILQMTAIGLGDVAAFPFVEPPDARSIADGTALLEELGALAAGGRRGRGRLTAIGRQLARLPVDPRLGRMVLAADRERCVAEVLVLAAALSIQDPRERPRDREQAAAEAHARFAVEGSDFLPFLRLWEHLRDEREARTSSGFRRMCRAEFLNHLRVREWQDLHAQLRVVTRSLGIRANVQPAPPESVHRALLAGLLSHVGMRDPQRREYLGARNSRFAVAPGSALFKKPPPWVVVAELVETTRLWGRVGASIEPRWVEELGGHLVRRSYGEPWWDAERGGAMVSERVTLYGIPVVAARTVPFARVDPAGARSMFLWHALVEGEWDTYHDFVAGNAERIAEVQALEDKARRRDLLVDEEARYAWFDARVPAEVTSVRAFDRWWRDERGLRPHLLDLSVEDLLDPGAGAVHPEDFPDVWRSGGVELPLTYVFDPGSDLDGVVVDVPLARLNDVRSDGFDWQVPGLRDELVLALIRSLPKAVRRAFVPAADHARAFVDEASPDEGPLLDALGRFLHRRAGEAVPPGSWGLERVPPHLRMTFRVVSERGRELAWSRDLPALQAHLQGRLRSAVAGATRSVERSGLTSWSVGTLPRTVDTAIGGYRVSAFPALVDEGATVGVRTFPDEAAQEEAMWAGTRRLLLLTGGSPVAAVQRKLRNADRLALAAAPYATVADVLDDAVTAALDVLLVEAGGPAWDEEGFRSLAAAVRARLVDVATDVTVQTADVLAAVRSVEERTADLTAEALQPALTDIAVQVARLVGPGFVTAAGAARLPDLRRYLRAVEHQLDRLPTTWQKDRVLMHRVSAIEAAYEELRARRDGAEVAALRWRIEELRVSLFAQSLGTAEPVSEQRLLREIRRLAAR